MEIANIIKNNDNFNTVTDIILNNIDIVINQKSYLLMTDIDQEIREMSYEYFYKNFKAMPIDLIMDIKSINYKFIKIAKELGYTVISDINDYKHDGELYDINGSLTANKGTIEEENIYHEDVLYPKTLSIDEFVLNPFFPVVFKNSIANRGEDKYLINNKEELDKMLKLFELPESKKLNLKEQFVAQEYIKGLDGINSSIRLFVTSSGDVLSQLFNFSTNLKSKMNVKKFGVDQFNPCENLYNLDSEFYLKPINITSNYSNGGKCIVLGENSNLIVEDELLLMMHDIDVDNFKLPQKVYDDCKTIASNYGSSKGIVMGIDFVFNAVNNEWYYLETNRNPSVEGYRLYNNLKTYSNKETKTLMQIHSIIKIAENINSRTNHKYL